MFSPGYFFEKLSQIPDEKWTTGHWEASEKCCVLGHLGERAVTRGYRETDESDAFRKLVETIGDVMGYDVNDGNFSDYTEASEGHGLCFKELGDTPKERVLNALVLIDSGIFNEEK